MAGAVAPPLGSQTGHALFSSDQAGGCCPAVNGCGAWVPAPNPRCLLHVVARRGAEPVAKRLLLCRFDLFSIPTKDSTR